MIIRYEFADGTKSNVEVSEELGAVILDSRKDEMNGNRRERYHCDSIEGADFEGSDYAGGTEPPEELFRKYDSAHIAEALSALTPAQRRRILLLAEGYSIADIARIEEADWSSVKESINAAKKKLKSILS